MARPRGDEWLEDEIVSLVKQGVSIIVSLLEAEEVRELGLTALIAGCLLIAKGRKFEGLFDQVAAARGLKVPDTEEQVRWLRARVR